MFAPDEPISSEKGDANLENLAFQARLLSSVHDAIVAADQNYIITYWNAPAEKMFGWKADEVTGKPTANIFQTLVPNSSREGAMEKMMNSDFHEGEVIYHHKDGHEIYTHVHANVLRNDGGDFLGTISSFRDITDRKKAEDALRKSEERLLALMKATSDVIYRMSPDWKTMTELYGRGFLADTEKPDACWLDKYIHPDDQKHVTGVIESCIRDKRMFELEHRVLRADGSIGWTYSRAVPLLHENGSIKEWFGAASDITGRRRSEEALRESEAKYYNLFDSIDEGYCIIEVLFDGDSRPLDYRFLEVKKSFEKQTGLVNAAGCRMRALIPDHEQHWFDIYGHIALTGEPVRFQNPAEALGRFYDVYAYRVGKPEQRRVAILFHDISDWMKAEEALCEKTRQLGEANQQKEDILESISDCFYVLDKDLRFTYVNKPAERMWGLPRADLIGRKIEAIFPGIIDISLSKFHQALREKSHQHYEVYSKVIGRWGDMGVYPMRNGISVYFRDITERKEAEEVLRRNQAREAFLLKLSDALRPLSDALEIKGAAMRIVGEHLGADCVMYNEITDDGKTIHIDDNYVRNGYPKVVGDFAVKSFGAAMDVLRRGEILAIHDQAASTLKMPAEREASMVLGVYASATVPLMKEGRWVANFGAIQASPRNWTEDEIAVLRETAERTWAAVERAKVEEALRESENHAHELVRELEQADSNKNQFLSALSHELRNPLAAISAGLQVLDITQDPNQAAKAKGIMNRQMNQLCHLVDDLLDLTRISHNKIELRKEKIELNGLALSVAEDNRPLYEEKGVKLITDIKDGPRYVNADPARIKQIIGNLLANALQFTNAGGKTLLSVYTEDDESIICVKDTGIGIKPKILPSLFTPFLQADASLDRRNGGLGLGLSIVKGIAELHGGSVSAYSEGLGKGSAFKIRLPLPKNGGAEEPEKMPAKEKKHSFRILLIEDNLDFADILCSALIILGHEVITANDGVTGIAKAKEYLPDVMFCDIGLPEMDGFEVAKLVRSEASIQNAYMVALTGYANQGDTEKALESGFDKHLAKPVDIATIREVLNNII